MNTFRMFWICFAASLGAILFTVAAEAPPLVTLIGGLTPIVVYHIRLALAPRQSLSAVIIDSVYYFGFLVTLVTLAVSVLASVQRGLAESLTPIAFQFGLGLCATIYALFARIHLISTKGGFEEENLATKVERYVQEAGDAVRKVRDSADAFEGLSKQIQASTVRVAEESRRAVSQVSENAIAEVRTFLETARTGIESLASALAEAAPTSEVDELKSGLRSFTGLITNLSRKVGQLGEHVGTSQNSVTTFERSIAEVQAEFARLSQRLQAIASIEAPIARVNENLGNIPDALKALEQQVRSLRGEWEQFGAQMGSAEKLLDETVRATASSLTQTSEATAAFAGNLAEATSRLSALGNTSAAIDDGQSDRAALQSELRELLVSINRLVHLLEDSRRQPSSSDPSQVGPPPSSQLTESPRRRIPFGLFGSAKSSREIP